MQKSLYFLPISFNCIVYSCVPNLLIKHIFEKHILSLRCKFNLLSYKRFTDMPQSPSNFIQQDCRMQNMLEQRKAPLLEQQHSLSPCATCGTRGRAQEEGRGGRMVFYFSSSCSDSGC